MLINSSSRGGSAVLELAVSIILIGSVGLGVYIIQHPQGAKPTPENAITAN